MARRLAVNVLCLVGAMIGGISVFSTWAIVKVGPAVIGFDWRWTIIDLINNKAAFSDWWIAGMLFLFGTLITFGSSLGLVPQIAGIVLFFFTFANHGNLRLGIGPFLGLASTVLVAISMIKPVGIESTGKLVEIKGHLFTFGFAPEKSP